MKKIILAILLAVFSVSVISAQKRYVCSDDWGKIYATPPVDIFLQNEGGSGGHSVSISFYTYQNDASVGNFGCILILEDWGGVFTGCTFHGIRVRLSNGREYQISTKDCSKLETKSDGTKLVYYQFSTGSLELFKKYRVLSAGVVASSEYNRNPKMNVEWWNKLPQGMASKIQRQAKFM